MPHGEISTILALSHSNHYPLKELSAFSISLPRLNAYLYGITRADWGDIGVGLRLN